MSCHHHEAALGPIEGIVLVLEVLGLDESPEAGGQEVLAEFVQRGLLSIEVTRRFQRAGAGLPVSKVRGGRGTGNMKYFE